MTTPEKKPITQQFEGVVVSDKMTKTVVVEVARLMKHPQYGKFIKRSKNYKAHDPESLYHTGDRVLIASCRPISRDKKWVVVKKIGTVNKVSAIDAGAENA